MKDEICQCNHHKLMHVDLGACCSCKCNYYVEKQEEDETMSFVKKIKRKDWLDFDEIADIIKMLGAYTPDTLINGMYFSEEYSAQECDCSYAIITSTTDQTKEESIYFGPSDDRGKGTVYNKDNEGVKKNGIKKTPEIQKLIDLFLKCPDLFVNRWTKLEKLRKLQQEIYSIAGQP